MAGLDPLLIPPKEKGDFFYHTELNKTVNKINEIVQFFYDNPQYGVIVYPTLKLNPKTGRLMLHVPNSIYENNFVIENGHLILKQS